VETEEQRRILLEQGCDFAQGYYFGRPAPAEAFTDYLTPAHAPDHLFRAGFGLST
jgi:EAL domain-containing protein (putative c-di-GMP-specific phosphodiesterase class I)